MRTIPSSTFQGRSRLLRHDPALGSSGRSVVHIPRHRETGRPRAAQFATWAVYIPGGGATWCGRKEYGMVTGDLLSLARTGDGEAFREAAQRADARPGTGMCLSPDRSCRPRATRPSGCAPDGKSHGHTASSDSNVPISSGRMWTGRRDRHSRRDRLPMLREMWSERLMTSKGLFREPADHGNRWRNPVAVGAFRA
jgi:hypothetical protein